MKQAKRKIIVKEIPVEDIMADDKNFNKGSDQGKELMDRSFGKFGAGRSILLDKNNRNIAGNKSMETFVRSGGKRVLVIETDRDTLVAVKRPDIDLDTKEGREMALADNQTQNLNYVVDMEVLEAVVQEVKIEPAEWGVDMEGAQRERVSFSAKKKYVVRVEFSSKGKARKAERDFQKIIREKYPDAVMTIKL